jgi:hypothetical protein
VGVAGQHEKFPSHIKTTVTGKDSHYVDPVKIVSEKQHLKTFSGVNWDREIFPRAPCQKCQFRVNSILLHNSTTNFENLSCC